MPCKFNMGITINRKSNPIRRLNGLSQKYLRAAAGNLKLKPKVFRPMSKVEREIRKLQRSSKLLASQRAFKDCIKNTLTDLKYGTGNFPHKIVGKALQRIFDLSV